MTRMRGPGGAWRGPIAGLRDVAEFLADEERASTFLRGLTVGALVGAAIAGSQIWRRRGGSAVVRGRSPDGASTGGPMTPSSSDGHETTEPGD